MANQPLGDDVVVVLEGAAHFKAAWVEACWLECYVEEISAMHGSAKCCFAVHHGQGNGGVLLLATAAGKDAGWGHAVVVKTFLPSLMAPPQQLMEVHHAGGIGVTEAHLAFELEPGRWLHG